MFGDFFPTGSDQDGDGRFMRAALDQARSAMGRTAPNPPVGAVIVHDGHIVGRGATQPPPGNHAEIIAIQEARESTPGSTLYVTLEPCCHAGRTPPCTDAVIAAGVARVVIGTADPNPLVNGRGISQLREAGIAVEIGCLEAEARSTIAGFASQMTRGRPYCRVKYAMTLDGKIATRTGHSRWISGPGSRELSHIMRDRCDAIMAGSGTVIGDNPRLTTRLPDHLTGYGGPHHPQRIVIDGGLRTPIEADVLQSGFGDQPIIYCRNDAPGQAEAKLAGAGALVRQMHSIDGHVDLNEVMSDLASRGVNELFVEGGGGLIGALFDARLVDEVVAFIGPMFVGGDGPSPVRGRGVATMPEAWTLAERRMRSSSEDIMIHGRVVYPEATHV